ncbi:MAG: hypothetical protein OJF51_004631 [Nitrospira sp.]|nr:MAG: hypothetical protein OJF51_004631 [Nitrospira sp.]
MWEERISSLFPLQKNGAGAVLRFLFAGTVSELNRFWFR